MSTFRHFSPRFSPINSPIDSPINSQLILQLIRFNWILFVAFAGAPNQVPAQAPPLAAQSQRVVLAVYALRVQLLPEGPGQDFLTEISGAELRTVRTEFA